MYFQQNNDILTKIAELKTVLRTLPTCDQFGKHFSFLPVSPDAVLRHKKWKSSVPMLRQGPLPLAFVLPVFLPKQGGRFYPKRFRGPVNQRPHLETVFN